MMIKCQRGLDSNEKDMKMLESLPWSREWAMEREAQKKLELRKDAFKVVPCLRFCGLI